MRIYTLGRKKIFFSSFWIVFLGTISNVFGQCPTISDNTQSFCDTQSPTVASLVATSGGNGIVWYANATGGSPLSNSIALINGEDYFADDISGSCGVRQSVAVTIYSKPIVFPAQQGFCEESRISDIQATGNMIQWYTTPTGGVPLAPSTILDNNVFYYASQINPDTGCETSRQRVLVTVTVLPVPTGDPIQRVCSTSAPTVANLVADAAGNDLVWYLSPNAGIEISPSTLLVDGQVYYAAASNALCESITRLAVEVQFSTPNNSGSNGSKNICVTDVTSTAPFNLINELNGSPDSTGDWTGPLSTTNGFQGTVDVSTLTLAGSPYVFTYTVSTSICPQSTSTVTINIIPLPNAGTNGTVSLCSNAPSQNLLGSLGGTPQASGVWTPTLASGSGLFNPAIDSAGVYTYTVTGTTPCPNATATVTVTIVPKPIAGTSASLSICGNSAAQDLFPLLGNTAQTGGTWTPALASGTGFYNPTIDPAGVYTYTVTGTPPCANATATVTVTKVLPPNAGTNGTVSLCSNAPSQNLFGSLGGAPQVGGVWTPALASGSGLFNPAIDAAGIYTYTVTGTTPCPNATATVTVTIVPKPIAGTSASLSICGNSAAQDLFPLLGNTAQTGGTWTPALASGTGLYNPTIDPAGVYTYTVTGTPPCANATATVTVTKVLPPNAGTNGTVSLCSNAPAQNLFGSLGGTPQAGGVWTPTLASGTGLFNPAIDAAGIYTYTVTGTTPCPNATATVTVTIVPKPIAGTSASLSICGNSAAQDLFPLLGNTAQTGGTWTPAIASGTGFYNPTIDPAGVYTYTVTGTPPCANATATVTVTKVLPPNAGTNGTVSLCSNSPAQNLLGSLGGSPQAGGVWTPTLASGTGLFNPAIDAAGVYTYTVTGTTPCPNATATVTVTIVPKPIAGTSASLSICGNSAAQDLFPLLGNTAQTGGTWTPAIASGTGFYNPTIDPAGVYTYTVTGTPPCANATATVTVTKVLPPNAGTNGTVSLCSNAPSQNLLGSLGGTPQAGGVWTPALASGSGLFNPAIDAAGVYTYTITGTTPCPNATATVTVTIIPKPIAGTSASLSICGNSAAQDLFPLLGNTAQTGGTWTPALASGTGFYNPTIDPTGVYTYTITGTLPCANATATVTVTKVLPPNAGTNGTVSLCSNAPAQNLFGSLGGTPQAGGVWTPTLASGTGLFNPAVDSAGIYTYTVIGTTPCPNATATVTVTLVPKPIAGNNSSFTFCQNSNPQDLFLLLGPTAQTGGVWTPALASGSGIFNPAIDLAGDYIYTVTGISPCTIATATVSVEVKPIPDAGIDAIADICSNKDPIDLFTFLDGTPQLGGTWTPALVSGTGFFNPAIDLAGQYTYTINGILPCVDDTAIITVNIIPGPDAGQPGNAVFCLNNTPEDLFTFLNGTPQVGGTWSPTLSSGTGIFNPALDPAGDYTYTFVGNQPCDDDTATVTVTVNPIPDAGENNSANICSNQDPVDLFTYILGTPQTGGEWTPTLASGTNIFNPAIDAAGNYTYTVGNPFCPPDSSIITVIITSGPEAGTNGTVDFCENATPQDLFLSLNGTPQVGGTWTPSLASGTGVFNPAIDSAGIYTYAFTGTNTCDNDSAIVIVTVSPIPNAGVFTGVQSVCTSSGTFDLFTLLNGNQSGGTWTDSNNQVVSNLIDVSTLIPNSYSYTYTIINSCGTDLEVVELIILANPVLNLPNIAVLSPICSGSNETISFSNMNDGNYVLNYELTGSNSSIQSAPLTILNGLGSFNINAFDIPNVGSTTITFLNIANATTSCGTLLADVSASFIINPLSNIENANLAIANTCIGSDATVLISNATGLIDGDYQFNYTIPQAIPTTGVTSTITISGGNGQFSIPGFGFTTIGNYSLTIDSIVSITGGCTNLNENATTGFEVLPIPDASGASISALNSCLNSSNQVQIIGATNLTDGNYLIDYQLSGVITASLNTTISITGGMGVFVIPAANLINTGIVTVTVSQISNSSTLCGTGLTFVTSTTFEVTTINDPVLVANGDQFCANENPIIADLAANIVGTDTVLFYNSNTGGTAYLNTDLLINGTIYYATLVSATGCESITRLQITVTLNVVDTPTISTNGNEFCITDNATISDLSANILGNGTIKWYDNSIGGNQYVDTTALIDGTIYYVTLTSSAGCESNPRIPITVTVNQIGDPIINDKGNEFCRVDNPTIAELSANIQGTNTVVWYDAETNGVAYSASDLLIDGTTYYATLVATSGCESQTRLAVTVDLNKCNDLLIPDGFSPNNDGVNETFEIKNLAEIYPNYKIEIYNRYGNLLYTGNIKTPNWNGTTSESGINLGTSEVPVGVYFYILEFNDGIQKPIQGRVYLIR